MARTYVCRQNHLPPFMEPEKLRRRICFAAAQLLHSRRETSFAAARWRAARAITRSYIPAESAPTDLEIRMALQQLVSTSAPQVAGPSSEIALHSDQEQTDDDACYQQYFELLQPLDRVRLPADTHPEGDLLYHSLQVFELAKAARPWDQDFLIAALLHDVGRGIDPYDSVAATLMAVQEIVSERSLWLIDNLATQHRASEGTIGARARRRIDQHPDADVLRLLAECDSEGRVPGRPVCSLQEAIDHLKQLDDQWC